MHNRNRSDQRRRNSYSAAENGYLKNVAANWTGRFVGCAEPFVLQWETSGTINSFSLLFTARNNKWTTECRSAYQALSMEFLLARFACQLRQLVRLLMDNAVANVALFNAFEFAVQIAFPQRQAITDGPILVCQKDGQLHDDLLGL